MKHLDPIFILETESSDNNTINLHYIGFSWFAFEDSALKCKTIFPILEIKSSEILIESVVLQYVTIDKNAFKSIVFNWSGYKINFISKP